MIEIDYKITKEIEVNGVIVSQTVRFYEGETSTIDEFDYVSKTIVPITAYRRTRLIEEVEYKYA